MESSKEATSQPTSVGEQTPITQPSKDVQELTDLLKVVQPFVPLVKDMVATFSQERTKQTDIIAKTQRRLVYCVTLLAAMAIGVAVCALFLQQVEVTEKIVIGLIGFLGGFGTAKGIGGTRS
jgi:hypothetical protein